MKKFILVAITVMTFFCMSLTTFASEDFPVFSPQAGYNFLEFHNDGTYYSYMWDKSSDISLKYNPSNGQVIVCGSGTVYRYSYNSSRESWGMDTNNELNLNDACTYVLGGNLLKTNTSIYHYESNEVVFPLPPNLKEATEEGLVKMTTSLMEVVSIVALCGVGCLALLIGLNLLRRKSVLFLNR